MLFGAGSWGGGGMNGRLVALASGIVLIAGGLSVWAALDHQAPPDASRNSDALVPVTIGDVTASDVPVFLHGIGTIQAFNTVTVTSRVDGPIVSVDFVEGQEVEAGAALLQIDSRPFEAALAQARAAKNKDAAQLESAELDLERYSKLLMSGVRTRQSYDQQKALVAQLKAAVEGDQAQIEAAELNLDFTRIRAPISGRLGARLVDVGNVVRASDGKPLVTIAQLRPIFVSFTLPQQNFDEIRQHQTQAPLTVVIFSGNDTRELARAQLTMIDNSIDAATGTIHLKAQFANYSEQLWPGEFVNVRVILSVRHSVPTVSSQAVQEGPDGYLVYVLEPGDTVHRRSVQVAAIQDGIAAITEGLQPGERVVIDGQFRLTNGARVKVVPPQPSLTAAGGPDR
jgi:multidrug efflux system membrane fusion protein